jgi:hypothetical protein
MTLINQDLLRTRRLLIAVFTALGSFLALLAFAAGPAAAASGDHFTCRGSAVRVTGLNALDAEPEVANSANSPCTTNSASAPDVAIPSVLTTGAASATTTSAAAGGSSTAQVANPSVSLPGLSADLASASASYRCVGTSPTPRSSSQVVNLTIGAGAPITSSGPVTLPIGGQADVELNQTVTTATSVTQRAVDISVLSGIDAGANIVLGEASAGVSGNPCSTGGTGGGTGAGGSGAGGAGAGQQPVDTVLPVISGTAKAGAPLTCSTGTWTGTPTSFTYVWSRDGTPIAGATSRTYIVHTSDEGLTLTCTVTAATATGAKSSATSKGVAVGVPHVARCPRATGRLSGNTLGLVRLGMTRTQARRAFTHSSQRGKRYEEFFCLTPIGVRVGYASPALLKLVPKGDRKQLQARVVWASTASGYYTIRGVRPGATLASARKRLRTGAAFHIGRNYWYMARDSSSTAVLKVRHGIVEEIGSANRQLTKSRKAQRSFMKSFS